MRCQACRQPLVLCASGTVRNVVGSPAAANFSAINWLLARFSSIAPQVSSSGT